MKPEFEIDPYQDVAERERILTRGIELTMGDRNKQYGEPVKNMQDIAELWNTYLGRLWSAKNKHKLTGEDVCHMMTLMKIARCFSGNPKQDNYIDAAVYQAMAGECIRHSIETDAVDFSND